MKWIPSGQHKQALYSKIKVKILKKEKKMHQYKIAIKLQK